MPRSRCCPESRSLATGHIRSQPRKAPRRRQALTAGMRCRARGRRSIRGASVLQASPRHARLRDAGVGVCGCALGPGIAAHKCRRLAHPASSTYSREVETEPCRAAVDSSRSYASRPCWSRRWRLPRPARSARFSSRSRSSSGSFSRRRSFQSNRRIDPRRSSARLSPPGHHPFRLLRF